MDKQRFNELVREVVVLQEALAICDGLELKDKYLKNVKELEKFVDDNLYVK